MAILSEDGRVDQASWVEYAAAHKDTYISAEPFPHIVIEDFLPSETVRALFAEFPPREVMTTKPATATTKNKWHTQAESHLGPTTLSVFRALNSEPFLQGLSALTGIEGLVNDPYLDGGGLHEITDGGYLKIHADFNLHSVTKLDRRLNLLFYINEHWPEAFGGELELWDEEMSKCCHKIAPAFNRCVIFSTTSTSYHGHPEPLSCGPDRSRRSLAFYYYTNGRPEEERRDSHSTLYQSRTPGDIDKKSKSVLKRSIDWFRP